MLLMAKQCCLGLRMLPIAALMAKQYCLGFNHSADGKAMLFKV
jgi:hypothetical protein